MTKSFKRGFTLLLLFLLVAFISHRTSSFTAPAGLWVLLLGLLPAYAAIRFPLREGLAATFLVGLLADTQTPLPFGSLAFLLTVTYCLAHAVRHRFRSRQNLWLVALAILLNSLLFLAISVLVMVRDGHLPGLLPLLAALTASSLLLAVLGPWLITLGEHFLRLIGAPVATDELK